MKSLPLSKARAKFSSLVSSVEATGKEIAITRRGKRVAVLLSMKVVEGWKETVAIKSDPRMMRDIRAGLRSLKQGKGKTYASLDELFADEDSRPSKPRS